MLATMTARKLLVAHARALMDTGCRITFHSAALNFALMTATAELGLTLLGAVEPRGLPAEDFAGSGVARTHDLQLVGTVWTRPSVAWLLAGVIPTQQHLTADGITCRNRVET